MDPSAPLERRIVITDDFGQRIQMSPDQFGDLLEQAGGGALSAAVADALA